MLENESAQPASRSSQKSQPLNRVACRLWECSTLRKSVCLFLTCPEEVSCPILYIDGLPYAVVAGTRCQRPCSQRSQVAGDADDTNLAHLITFGMKVSPSSLQIWKLLGRNHQQMSVDLILFFIILNLKKKNCPLLTQPVLLTAEQFYPLSFLSLICPFAFTSKQQQFTMQ